MLFFGTHTIPIAGVLRTLSERQKLPILIMALVAI